MRYAIALLLFLLPMAVHAQSSDDDGSTDGASGEAPFVVYTGDGARASVDALVQASDTVSVVFVGEVHDDPGAHALQDTLFRRLVDATQGSTTESAQDAASRRPLALSLEMFERDVQPVVDEYLAGLISEQHFVTDARAWSNYASAYRPLVERAKQEGLPVLAANAPRRYVSRVAQAGRQALDDLPAHADAWLPPGTFPGPSDAYRQKWVDLMRASMPPGHGSGSSEEATDGATQDTADVATGESADSTAASPHGGMGASHGMGGTMLLAQSLWDATMAYTLADYLMTHPGALVLHVTGRFHVSEGTGTPEALQHYRPGTSSVTIVVRPTDDPTSFDAATHGGRGDFVVLTAN